MTEGSADQASDLQFREALPVSYEFIDEAPKYEFGSGADNEDELHDLTLDMEREKEEERKSEYSGCCVMILCRYNSPVCVYFYCCRYS